MTKLASILFFLIAFTSYGRTTNCSQFKTGIFKYANPIYTEWQISRTDSTQVEISSISGIEVYSSVVWKSDCEFVLTCNKVKNADSETLLGKIVTVKIIKTTNNSYTCNSKSNDFDLELEMIKID